MLTWQQWVNQVTIRFVSLSSQLSVSCTPAVWPSFAVSKGDDFHLNAITWILIIPGPTQSKAQNCQLVFALLHALNLRGERRDGGRGKVEGARDGRQRMGKWDEMVGG